MGAKKGAKDAKAIFFRFGFLIFCSRSFSLSPLLFAFHPASSACLPGSRGVALADFARGGRHAGFLLHFFDHADGQIGGVVAVEVDFAVGKFFEVAVLPGRLREAGFAKIPTHAGSAGSIRKCIDPSLGVLRERRTPLPQDDIRTDPPPTLV